MGFQLRSGKAPLFKKLGSKTPLFKKNCKSPFYSGIMRMKINKLKSEGYVKNNPQSVKNSIEEF